MKNCNRLKIFCLIFAAALVSAGCGNKKTDSKYNTPLFVGDKEILVSVARTEKEKALGLSGSAKLNDNQGMLFDFYGAENFKPGFWMKDMLFNLDLIWIKDKKIIGITADVPHPKSNDDELPIYYPPSGIDQVLEVNGGWSESHGIGIGDAVLIQN